MHRLTVMPILLFVALFLSCGQENDYAACPMPQAMEEECEQSVMDGKCENLGVDCKASCIVNDHPECRNNPCLMYNYTDPTTKNTAMTKPFCSKECTPDDPKANSGPATVCGEEALCMPFLDSHYCIPLTYITKQQ